MGSQVGPRAAPRLPAACVPSTLAPCKSQGMLTGCWWLGMSDSTFPFHRQAGKDSQPQFLAH